MKLSIVVLLVVILAVFFFISRSSDEFDIKIDSNNEYVIENSDFNFRYQLADSYLSMEGVGIFLQYIENPVEYGGTLIRLMYLDNSAAQIHADKYGVTGGCPAPFLNKYGKEKWIYASSIPLKDQILELDLPNYNHPQTWQKISIRGKCIQSQISGKDKGDGAPLMLPDSHFNNCRSLLVDNLVVYPFYN
ncbi:hypothetical protein H0A36_14525 [Endozoicomonas sp. SM1973]|uniref:Uncharacterized protein n=1 Tax=Spartinivicinus marinus TaxID=2994442 RepID=A0A853HZT2_9GAMM|nr:hypothetical protein [Spartinivicinus marinus]MCX4028563.1 hypothetical protein [Spartinivicinus marinus]NYZ67230.1 hypothetical protein [Spartinivicinus marinus]